MGMTAYSASCWAAACSANLQDSAAALTVIPASCWLCKPTQQLEVPGELEGLIRQCFHVVGSIVVETRYGLHTAADRNQLPSQASLG